MFWCSGSKRATQCSGANPSKHHSVWATCKRVFMDLSGSHRNSALVIGKARNPITSAGVLSKTRPTAGNQSPPECGYRVGQTDLGQPCCWHSLIQKLTAWSFGGHYAPLKPGNAPNVSLGVTGLPKGAAYLRGVRSGLPKLGKVLGRGYVRFHRQRCHK